MDFHEKRKFKRLLYSKITLIILGLIVIWLSFVVWSMYEKERDTRLKRIEQREILNELEGRESSLREEIERLSTERGIEEEVRSKFEVGKDGEEIIIIVDNPEGENAEKKETEKTFWQKMYNWF
ncbi:MAG: septum formation initiator family protein [Patescibacteria group bacterium]